MNIRPATRDDLEFLIWIMMQAGRSHLDHGLWETVFKTIEPESVLRSMLVTDTLHFCHYSGFHIMEDAEGPVSACSGFNPKEQGVEAFTKTLLAELQSRGLAQDEIFAVLMELNSFRRVYPFHAQDAWALEWCAIAPRVRGQGLAAKMVSYLIAEGFAKGWQDVYLPVFHGNDKILKMYASLNLKLESSHESANFKLRYGVPGMKLFKGSLGQVALKM